MARDFFHTTAEQIVAVVDAVCVNRETDVGFVERFCDLTNDHAENALGLATDIGFLSLSVSNYRPTGPFARFLSTFNVDQKAAVLRVMLESYEPFVIFRQRLISTASADKAARQTIAVLNLSAHHEHVKDTLLNLGMYARALKAEGGGKYSHDTTDPITFLQLIADGCTSRISAEQFVRLHLATAADFVSRDEVVVPLSDACMKANDGKASEAVTSAGNAVESYLEELAGRMSVSLSGAAGIIQKLEKFRSGNNLPKKIIESGKYLGQVRNAADHGIDPDVGVSWQILEDTGKQYVMVACSFIQACHEREVGGAFII